MLSLGSFALIKLHLLKQIYALSFAEEKQQLGLRDLRDPEVRSAVCVSCQVCCRGIEEVQAICKIYIVDEIRTCRCGR